MLIDQQAAFLLWVRWRLIGCVIVTVATWLLRLRLDMRCPWQRVCSASRDCIAVLLLERDLTAHHHLATHDTHTLLSPIKTSCRALCTLSSFSFKANEHLLKPDLVLDFIIEGHIKPVRRPRRSIDFLLVQFFQHHSTVDVLV